MAIWGADHDDVDLDTYEPVETVDRWAFDRASPSRSMPSVVKKAVAAARSSTTTLI